ncbi:SpvB/TcaC N-terminal domain-containing protein [Pseudomonas sp. NPDC098747]|uniref:SpvB/TcaC N-terminal domain-containing protein n=1 Tax=Pseudomonas sp. NPDC098747 TaxID=3364487 RepID=UPI00383B1FF7
MDKTSLSQNVAVSQLSLPKGGGSIRGMGETLGGGGATGQSTLSVPLPISSGRGYAPPLSLEYGSGQGNGRFGVGWDVATLTIRRRTSKGVPRYQGTDDYLAPNGEVMAPELDKAGQVVSTAVSQYGGLSLDQTYEVTRYFPALMTESDRIEHWLGTGEGGDFWLIHSVDGQLHCLGKSPLSRIADPTDQSKIGQWLLDESCTLNGEHIRYVYQCENSENVDMQGQEAGRAQSANRYLMQVQYGNASPYAPLYAWGMVPAADQPRWLFTLVFDYGERTLLEQSAPAWHPDQPWAFRQDSFSDYALGFEVRTHRLCHQVLMFHHFPDELGEPEFLVHRLLLRYEQTRQLSRLVSAQSCAYDVDGMVQSLPPLELMYTAFKPDFSTDAYCRLPAFPGRNDGAPYQLVDLYGEGVPGILYQVEGDWRYQAPQRGNDGPDSIAYSPSRSLPLVPSLNPERQRLMDISGDGRLDWIIAEPAMAGYFTLNPDHNWSRFIPLPAFPTELLQPSAQLANLIGSGLADLALIGPNSVRLYPNAGLAGFGPSMDVAYAGDKTLPVFNSDPGALVAFSDVLGSGQAHLVRVRCNSLECWPNLGRGKFGSALMLTTLDFDPATFDPARVFLADIDGSGAADLIYAESDHFKIFLNQSGNGYETTPLILPMPSGVRYDMLSQVSFVDMSGTGMANLVLTISHMTPAHFCYAFTNTKPFLLEQINNNLGACSTLTYRSSAQEWLDEKKENPDARCHLPFPMPLLSSTVSLDEISGNQLSQSCSYLQGVYAGLDREFRGFGFVQQLDTTDLALPTAADVPNTAPTLTKTWFHTGLEDSETSPTMSPYEDPAMFPVGLTRLTSFNTETTQDEALGTVDTNTRYQLYRALKGRLLRMEVYGVDGSLRDGVPYTVETRQYQVRLLQPASLTHPYCVAMPSELAQLTTTYDRIANDPQVEQAVCLHIDPFGTPLHEVKIYYARRPQAPTNPYAPEVPDAQWHSSYDNDQDVLRLIETRRAVYNLDDPQAWRMSLAHQLRENFITAPHGYTGYPANNEGLDYTDLLRVDGVIGITQTRVLSGQQVTYYFDQDCAAPLPAGVPPPPLALIHHTETAELDDEMLAVYNEIQDIESALTDAGYRQQPVVLNAAGMPASTVWVVPSGYIGYADSGVCLPFFLPRAQQSTLIVGPQRLEYDLHYCVVASSTDAASNQTRAEYDYRFLTPWKITDPNFNQSQVLYDPLGRVIASSFFGTQLAPDELAPVDVGFAPVSEFDANAAALNAIALAIADPGGALQQAASVSLYQLHSWMGQISTSQLKAYLDPSAAAALWQSLQQARLITASGHVLAKGRQWARHGPDIPGVPSSLRTLFRDLPRAPIHSAVFAADQFPDAPDQQIQIMLEFSDGFGRSLQSQQKAETGLSYIVDHDGQLVLDSENQLVIDDAAVCRWMTSGKVDYNNKGLPVRQYQPYFVDKPIYVNAASGRRWGYVDTYYYDPLGREKCVVNAQGFLQRQSYYPWFSITEDLNDTLHEVLSS